MLLRFLQAVTRNCQFATELIEYCSNEHLPDCHRQPGHARMKTPAGLIGAYVFQGSVVHAEQPYVLKVGLNDPPTATEIFVEPAFCQFGKLAPDILRRSGVRVQLGVAGNVAEAETARVYDPVCHGVERQFALPLQRREKR